MAKTAFADHQLKTGRSDPSAREMQGRRRWNYSAI